MLTPVEEQASLNNFVTYYKKTMVSFQSIFTNLHYTEWNGLAGPAT